MNPLYNPLITSARLFTLGLVASAALISIIAKARGIEGA